VNGTKFTPNGFALRFYQLRVQHALMTYTLLPVRIKTSNIDAAQLARRNPGDPRRRTGDPQDPLMLGFMTSTLVATTLHHAAFPSADIHVWLSYLRHPFRRYSLQLDT